MHIEWENEVKEDGQNSDRKLEVLETVHTYWDITSEYFVKLQLREKGFKYFDLVASHTRHAVNYWGDAWHNIREHKTRDHYGLRDWIAEGAHKYFDYMESIAKDMGGEKRLVEEAWIMMMFRAFCWWRCHYMVEGENMSQNPSRLPSRYWDSKLPVYIG